MGWHDLLAVGFDPSSRHSIAAECLYLRRWQQRHGALPPALLALLRDQDHGPAAEFAKLVAWVLWLKRHARGAWRHYIDMLPQVR